jgi:GNAT superfamily N-acetyltransferase
MRVMEGSEAPVIRRASAGDVPVLSDLAMRSKARWGYDAAFMEAFAADLRLTPELIAEAAAFVAEVRGDGRRALGFYVLSIEKGLPTLRDLWVEPGAMGRGVGAALFAHMRGQARVLGYSAVRIESDPNAEGFYVRMGARRIGGVASSIVPGRVLPLLELDP